MTLSQSGKRFEKELKKAREENQQKRRWEVRSEPLLKLRTELACAAVKMERVADSAHKLHTRIGMTEEEAKEQLQKNVDLINAYLESGEFMQALFTQYDLEVVSKVEDIIKKYRTSFLIAINWKGLKATELGEAMEALNKNKAAIIEVQALINKRLEEL